MDFIKENMNIIVPSTITIIGFIINYYSTKSTIKNQIEKKKMDIYLDKLIDVPLDLINTMELMMRKGKEKQIQTNYTRILTEIFIYGTEDSIKIASYMQQKVYKSANTDSVEELSERYAAIIILVCQLKSDITGIKINPSYWYKLKISDYEEHEEQYVKATNKIIKELELGDFLYI